MSRRYSQLNLADRRRLFHFVERKLPIKEMARELGRHRSTIYREIRRNTFHDRELPDYSGYFPTVADDIRKERRQRLTLISASVRRPSKTYEGPASPAPVPSTRFCVPSWAS